jgi:hypothetical protein
MIHQTDLATQFREHVARQVGYILMHLLLAAQPLADDLDNALWMENADAALAWFTRELPREIMKAVPNSCRKQFMSGVYRRYWDDYV